MRDGLEHARGEVTGVKVAELAKMAKVRDTARHVIFEAAAGYTANVRIAEALAPSVMLAHKHEGQALTRPHGPAGPRYRP